MLRCIVCVLGLSGQGGPRLSLEEAIREGFVRNPIALQTQFSVEGSRAFLASQRAPLNPTFNFGGVNNSVALPDFGDSSNYGLSFTIETSGRQRLRTDIAKALLGQSIGDAEAARLNLRQTIVSAYIDLQSAQKALEVERETLATVRKLSDLATSQFKVGSAPETNAMRAEIALRQEEINLARSETAKRAAVANLDVALGSEPTREIEADDIVEVAPSSLDEDSLLREALEHRPEIASARANVRALSSTVAMQRAQSAPDLTLASDAGSQRLFIGFSMPLVDFGSIRGSVRKAQRDVDVARTQLAQTESSVRLDVRLAVLSVRQAEAIVNKIRTEVLARAIDLRVRIEKGFALGGNTILEVIDAQQTERSTRLDYASALADLARARAQLDRATGRTRGQLWMK